MFYALFASVSTVVSTASPAPTVTATIVPTATVIPTPTFTFQPLEVLIKNGNELEFISIFIALLGVIATFILGRAALKSSKIANKISEQQVKREEEMRIFEHKFVAYEKVAEIYDFFTNVLTNYESYSAEQFESIIPRINTLESEALFLFKNDTYKLVHYELNRIKDCIINIKYDIGGFEEEVKQYDSTITEESLRTMRLVCGNSLKYAIRLLGIIMPNKIKGILEEYRLNL